MGEVAVHRAKFVMTRPERLLEDAAVRVADDGRILQVGAWGGLRKGFGSGRVTDWGDALLMPGLVNAHTHLELTALGGKVTRFDSFADWALQLIRARRVWTPEEYRASTQAGARLALASGTTLVGDIASSDVGWDALADALPCDSDAVGATVPTSPRRVVFEEALGLAPGLADAALDRVRGLFRRADQGAARPLQTHAVSPHAPYSTSGELYRKVAAFAQSRDVTWTTHVAETLGELRFFEDGGGEFREFLSRLGAFPEGWAPPGRHPVAWLDGMGVLGASSLLAHCNYLDGDALRRLARRRAPVVYCPRSHDFFGHGRHPIRDLIDAGVPVALGTDSLASNGSLDMLEEMRFLGARRKDLTAAEVFHAATGGGAVALGFAGRLGALEPGYFADMAVVDLPPVAKPAHLLGQILEGAGRVRATVIAGAPCRYRVSGL